ncbi:hypothetical protein EYF80_021963 [Liparis tanakae]|uniref:Uncharacterized protein n=1 Tax=Liparis tanakae TaxID=230148 RepID=A0A4Z2HPP3_9TELE|nr:hypothetical protein EYF80_021963 [Liparis tanakae]
MWTDILKQNTCEHVEVCELSSSPAEINAADVTLSLLSCDLGSPGEQSSPCLDFLWQLLPVSSLVVNTKQRGFYLTRQILYEL